MKKLLDSLSPASEVLKIIVYTITLLFFLAILCLILLFGLGRLVSQLYPQSQEVAVVMQPNTAVQSQAKMSISYMYLGDLPLDINFRKPVLTSLKKQDQLFIEKMDFRNPYPAITVENSKKPELYLNQIQPSLLEMLRNSKSIIGKDLLNLLIAKPIEKNNKIYSQKKCLIESQNLSKYDGILSVFPLAAAVGAGALLGGSIIGSSSSAAAQSKANETNLQIARETNAANAALAQQQQNWNIDLWNMQNEYNTPAAQMQRYKDAGLNPNLIYGSGSGSSGNATAVSSVAPARMERASVQPVNYFQGIAQGMSQAMSAFLQSQQLSVAEKRAEADLTRTASNVDLNISRQGLIQAQTFSETLRPEQIAANINKLNQDTARQFVETGIRSSFQIHSDIYYKQQVEAQALSMKLTNSQIDKVAYELGHLLPLQASQISVMIQNLRAGMTLRELESQLKQTDVDWKTADKIINAITGVLSGISKFK